MAIFKRVYCSDCKKNYNVYNGVKRLKCTVCGKTLTINSNNTDYYIEYYYSGKKRRESVGGSRSVAEIVLRKRKNEIAEGKYTDIRKDEKIKFEDFADFYLERHSKVNNKSWKKSDWVILRALKKFFACKYLHEITPLMIEEFKSERLKTVKPGTVNRNLIVLKSMFSKAIEWEMFSGINPVKKVKALPSKATRLRFLEKEEIPKLVNCCDEELKPLVIFSLNTGVRQGELLKIKWRDVDYRRGIVNLYDRNDNFF